MKHMEKKKTGKTNEQILSDMRDNIMRPNMCNYNPEKNSRRAEKNFEELINDFFLI